MTMATILERVFPACAGMILYFGDVSQVGNGVPRMRGDDPAGKLDEHLNEPCSPHARG